MSATVSDTDRLDDDGLDRKIDQLASVIAVMNTGEGPDLLAAGVYPKANPIWRNGQAGQSERILRPLPNRHDRAQLRPDFCHRFRAS